MRFTQENPNKYSATRNEENVSTLIIMTSKNGV